MQKEDLKIATSVKTSSQQYGGEQLAEGWMKREPWATGKIIPA